MSATSPTTPESSLVGTGAFPPTYEVVRHVISFLKWRFSLLPPGSYQWKPETEDSPDQTGSEVFISADTPIRPEVVGKRPAITALRSQAAFQGVGLGDVAYTDWKTGAVVRMDLIPTNVMITALSQLPVEAERLAWFCAEQIWTLRDEIVVAMPALLYLGQRPSISAPSPAGSLVAESTDFEWCAVVVGFPCFLQHSTTKMPLNRRVVGGFTLAATTTGPEAPGAQIVPLQGTAVMQPAAVKVPAGALTGPGVLPQGGDYDAKSKVPLTVEIKPR